MQQPLCAAKQKKKKRSAPPCLSLASHLLPSHHPQYPSAVQLLPLYARATRHIRRPIAPRRNSCLPKRICTAQDSAELPFSIIIGTTSTPHRPHFLPTQPYRARNGQPAIRPPITHSFYAHSISRILIVHHRLPPNQAISQSWQTAASASMMMRPACRPASQQQQPAAKTHALTCTLARRSLFRCIVFYVSQCSIAGSAHAAPSAALDSYNPIAPSIARSRDQSLGGVPRAYTQPFSLFVFAPQGSSLNLQRATPTPIAPFSQPHSAYRYCSTQAGKDGLKSTVSWGARCRVAQTVLSMTSHHRE